MLKKWTKINKRIMFLGYYWYGVAPPDSSFEEDQQLFTFKNMLIEVSTKNLGRKHEIWEAYLSWNVGDFKHNDGSIFIYGGPARTKAGAIRRLEGKARKVIDLKFEK